MLKLVTSAIALLTAVNSIKLKTGNLVEVTNVLFLEQSVPDPAADTNERDYEIQLGVGDELHLKYQLIPGVPNPWSWKWSTGGDDVVV